MCNDPIRDAKIGPLAIWAIGVGSALGGDFFGWEFVLYGGFLSALIATGFAASFFWLYAGAITELAARYRSSGGSFDYVRAALGNRAGALMATLGLLKLLLANSAIALAISSYLIQGGMPSSLQPLCWILTYGTFTLLDCIGVRQSANIQILATVLCIFILVFYSVSSLQKFSIGRIKTSGLINDGIIGFFKGFPFALQFFDGFEEVPLLMGYASDPEKNIPQAIISCYVTIAAIAVMILISGSGITPFSTLIDSEAPLMDGIDAVYGQSSFISDAVANLIVVGLLVNFFAFVVFSSQQMQAVASAGQLPAFLAYRDATTGAPITASICSSTIGLVLTAGFALVFGESAAQDTLVTAALMPAILGYALLLQCIIRTRSVEERILNGHTEDRDEVILGRDPGPLRFYWGVPGARLAQLMCLIFVISLFVLAYVSRSFRWGLAVLGLILAILLVGNMKGLSKKGPRNARAANYGATGNGNGDGSDEDEDEDRAALLPNTDVSADTYFSDFSSRRSQYNTIADLKSAMI